MPFHFMLVSYFSLQQLKLDELNKKGKLLVSCTIVCLTGTMLSRYYKCLEINPINVNVAVNFLFQVIFVFPLFQIH